ncbi:hypothetical protein DEA98_25525 [Brucella pseudogrignonensis]|nr:hypothetical protein [Brucella pseudogrignonensis]
MSALSALGTRCCRPISRRFAFSLPLSPGISATGCDGGLAPGFDGTKRVEETDAPPRKVQARKTTIRTANSNSTTRGT